MIDYSKPVQTRGGQQVRILCTDAPGSHPIVGYIETGAGAVDAMRWRRDGRSGYFRSSNDSFRIDDLVQVEEPVVKFFGIEPCGETWHADLPVPEIMAVGRNGRKCLRVFKLTFLGDKVTGELVR